MKELVSMKCRILHESRGRLRVRLMQNRMSLSQADHLEYYLKAVEGVTDVKVYDRTRDAVIYYKPDRKKGNRETLISALADFSYDQSTAVVPDHTSRALNREYEDKLVSLVLWRLVRRLFLPIDIRRLLHIRRASRFMWRGVKSLRRGRLEVSVLDAVAITTAMVRGDFNTSSSIMFLLKVGEILEEWTHKKSVADLASTMSLGVDKVWLLADGQEILTPVSRVKEGDHIVVRTGNMIPLDGCVISGDMMVNQASLTGESLPVHRTEGGYVYAGTVVEEGVCTIEVGHNAGSGKYDRIVRMIEESEKLKSRTEDRAAHLADHLVPYSLAGTLLTWLITKNAARALSILMVDFSCALKLSMPLAVLAAMREAGTCHISVKGGVFLENVSEAETIVFDKTGTLTHAVPRVVRVVTFGGYDETEMLRVAACLEEHYPHSMARAVVEAAKAGPSHEEELHSTVDYVVAHGISSRVEGKKVIIGSRHFVFEDEKCLIPRGEKRRFNVLPSEYSHLYMAIEGKLAAVICVEDPIREEAADVIRLLHKEGVGKIVMMTGDSRHTAKAVAERIGLDEVYAEVLPENKAAFIEAEHAEGRKVVMIGDGVNDAPALSAADVGIAISDGAAIAREVADITISADDLYTLVTLRRLSEALMHRIRINYRFIMGFNSALIALGIAGILPPASSALLHNTSTIAISLKSMTDYLK